MQYLLVDPPATAGVYKGFASGLEFPNGKKKATFFAYRMPFYMPKTSFSRSQNVEVWGSVRPAPFATLDGFGAQRAQIQLDSGSGFKTINTVTVKKGGYFDVHMKFPSSGTVRVQWTYPASDSFLDRPRRRGPDDRQSHVRDQGPLATGGRSGDERPLSAVRRARSVDI